jgi:hypothetical protein
MTNNINSLQTFKLVWKYLQRLEFNSDKSVSPLKSTSSPSCFNPLCKEASSNTLVYGMAYDIQRLFVWSEIISSSWGLRAGVRCKWLALKLKRRRKIVIQSGQPQWVKGRIASRSRHAPREATNEQSGGEWCGVQSSLHAAAALAS